MSYRFCDIITEIIILYFSITIGTINLRGVACEMPIVYNILKKDTEQRKKLFLVIIGSNVLTTVLTAVVERTLCYGRW